MLCKPGDLSLIPGTQKKMERVVQITCAYMYTHTQFIKQKKTIDINGKCIKRNTHV